MQEIELSSEFNINTALCRVCGEDYSQRNDYICCPGCQTPAHIECFEYQGGCPQYACGYQLDHMDLNQNYFNEFLKTIHVIDDEGKYEISYFPSAVYIGKNYSGCLETVPEGYRISTLSEEITIQNHNEETLVNPEDLEDLSFLFRNLELVTATSLRIPKGVKKGEYDKMIFRKTGKKIYIRDVIEFEKVVAEGVEVPEGEGYVMKKMDGKYGLPKEMHKFEHNEYTKHFFFNPNSEEVSVTISSIIHPSRSRCFGIFASASRDKLSGNTAVRYVDGPLPRRKEIKSLWQKTKEIANTDISDLFK